MTHDMRLEELWELLDRGGTVIWIIAALSIVTLALVLWKVWRLLLAGAWSRGATLTAVAAWADGDRDRAERALARRGSLRARLALAAMRACSGPLPEAAAREETVRVARALLAEARAGLRAIELSATIAPLLGLLGTVLGMIVAFQALQEAGARADPAALAGGIWEALLTTAAGMAVAILASVALAWFDAVVERLRHDMEDIAARIFVASRHVAESPE